MREEGGVLVCVLGIGRGVGDGVLRSSSQLDFHSICTGEKNCRPCRVIYGHTVEDQCHLGVITGVDNQLTLVCTGDRVRPGFRDCYNSRFNAHT